MNQNEVNDRRFNIPDALIGVAIPIYGYFLTYIFFRGYCYKLGIPNQFIEIGISNILICVSSMLVLLLFYYLIYEIFFTLGFMKNWKRQSVVFIFRDIILVSFFVFIFSPVWYEILIICTVILSLNFFGYIYPHMKGAKIEDEHERFEESIKHLFIRRTFLWRFLERTGMPPYFLITLFAIYIVAISYFVGAFIGKTQSSYLVIKSQPEQIVIYKFSGKLLCTTFDRKTKKIDKKFQIRSYDQIEKDRLQIDYEEIGPLIPKSKNK